MTMPERKTFTIRVTVSSGVAEVTDGLPASDELHLCAGRPQTVPGVLIYDVDTARVGDPERFAVESVDHLRADFENDSDLCPEFPVTLLVEGGAVRDAHMLRGYEVRVKDTDTSEVEWFYPSEEKVSGVVLTKGPTSHKQPDKQPYAAPAVTSEEMFSPLSGK